MAKVVYKSYNRNEGSRFPVYLSDRVPAEHPARVVDAVVYSYDIDTHSYDVDPLEEGRAFKEQSLFACKQAAA